MMSNYAILTFLVNLSLMKAFQNRLMSTMQRPARQLHPLRRGNLFDDDLPSIFGINPVEAAIIAGGLYYIYGPEKLYEFSREAGRYVSTYGPLLKQASFDIFYEFRDYFDEDREREQLRKAGVDVNNLPRRTSNIIERFQAILGQFSETNQGSSEVLRTAYRSSEASKSDSDDDNQDTVLDDASTITSPSERSASGGKKRKTKREVLIERNIDVNKVIEATTAIASSSDEDLAQSISMVENSFTSLKSAADAQLPPIQQQVASAANGAFTNPLSTETITMSKFQQQLSGEWNTRVLRRSRYEDNPSNVNNNINYNSVGGSSDVNELPNSFVDEDDLTDDEYQKLMMTDSTFNPYDDLSQFDTPGPGVRAPEIEDLESSSIPLPMPPFDDYQATSFPAADSSTNGLKDVEAEQFLKEIDRDYLTLRSKILAFMQAKQQPEPTKQLGRMDDNKNDDEQFSDSNKQLLADALQQVVSSSSSMDKQKKKYWPPQKASASRIGLE